MSLSILNPKSVSCPQPILSENTQTLLQQEGWLPMSLCIASLASNRGRGPRKLPNHTRLPMCMKPGGPQVLVCKHLSPGRPWVELAVSALSPLVVELSSVSRHRHEVAGQRPFLRVGWPWAGFLENVWKARRGSRRLVGKGAPRPRLLQLWAAQTPFRSSICKQLASRPES